MAFRRQIPATGWKAVLKHKDGSYSTLTLVCFELLCADEDDEDDIASYDPIHPSAKCREGSATEAIGLAFFEGHPREQPSLFLSEVHTIQGFIGYLPPGENLKEWLESIPH